MSLLDSDMSKALSKTDTNTTSVVGPTPTASHSATPTPAQKKSRQIVGALCVVLIIAVIIGAFTYLFLQRRKRIRQQLLDEQLKLQSFEETPRTLTFYGFPPGGSHRGLVAFQRQYPPPAAQQAVHILRGSAGNSLLVPPQLLQVLVSPISAGPVRSPGGTNAAAPEYSEKLSDGEQILGRGGDRACDTINSPPESQEEAEAKRNHEMESLFQIRQARRNETVAKVERSKRRNAAKIAGDYEALAALRQEGLDAAAVIEREGSICLIRRYESRDKSKKIASVNYHGLGTVRQDGSKVRSGAKGEPLVNTEYDFEGDTWEAETIDGASIRSGKSSSSSSAAGSRRGSSTGAAVAGNAAQKAAPGGSCCAECIGVFNNANGTIEHSPACSAFPPSYSALSWDTRSPAPPYSSPLVPLPRRAVSPATSKRVSMASVKAIKSPVQSRSTSPAPTQAVTPSIAVTAPAASVIGSTDVVVAPGTAIGSPTAVVPVVAVQSAGAATHMPTPTISITAGTPVEAPSAAHVNPWAQSPMTGGGFHAL